MRTPSWTTRSRPVCPCIVRLCLPSSCARAHTLACKRRWTLGTTYTHLDTGYGYTPPPPWHALGTALGAGLRRRNRKEIRRGCSHRLDETARSTGEGQLSDLHPFVVQSEALRDIPDESLGRREEGSSQRLRLCVCVCMHFWRNIFQAIPESFHPPPTVQQLLWLHCGPVALIGVKFNGSLVGRLV